MMNSYIDTGAYSQTFYQIVALKEDGCNCAPRYLAGSGKNISDGLITSNITHTQIGITELQIEVNIFPNPSHSGLFTIQGENITNIDVYNSVGQLIISTTNPQNTIDLSQYCNGIYYTKITTHLGTTNRKLIKQ